ALGEHRNGLCPFYEGDFWGASRLGSSPTGGCNASLPISPPSPKWLFVPPIPPPRPTQYGLATDPIREPALHRHGFTTSAITSRSSSCTLSRCWRTRWERKRKKS